MKKFLARVLWILLLAISIYFLFRMYKFNILPLSKFALVLGVVFIILAVVLVISGKPGAANFSIVFTIVLIGVYAYLAYSLTISKEMVDNITGNDRTTQSEYVALVGLKGHYLTLESLNKTTIGLDTSISSEPVEIIFNNLKKESKLDIKATKVQDITELVDGLYDETYSAILIESARLPILENIKESFSEDTIVIMEYAIVKETTVPVSTPSTKPDKNQANKPSKPSDTAPTEPNKNPDKPEKPKDTRPITERPFIVYISGIDTVGNIATKSRSDTNILMCISPAEGKILLISTPRDTYTPLYNVSGDVKDKLTHAGLYGIDCSIGTLETLYGINIDYYVRVNFTSVETIVDALGGVNVYSAKTFDSGNIKGYHFDEGMNEVNGKKALVFCRERYAFSDGDFQRGRNHIEMIKAVFNKCTSPSIVIKLPELIAALSESFQTDMSSDELTALIRYQIDTGTKWNFDSTTLNNKGGLSTTCYSLKGPSLYVGYIDEASLKSVKQRINDFFN